MATLVAALFNDSKDAGETISRLKEQGYTKDISVVSKDIKEGEIDVDTHQVKQDTSQGVTTGATTGAVAGAVVGSLGAVIAGITATALPGGVVVAGPLAAGLLGAATGALTGGIVGWLVERGVPDERAKQYEDRVLAGETLVTVTTDAERAPDVVRIINDSATGTAEVEQFNV